MALHMMPAHLEHHVGTADDFRQIAFHGGPGFFVGLVGETRMTADALLHHDLGAQAC